MSFSVDDLVASLNSNHIGQEAIDLATLQAQLAAALFPARSPRATSSHHQPCNTPLARTPSNSISMGNMSIDIQAMSVRTSASSRRGSYSTPHHNNHALVHSHSRNDIPMSPPSAFHHLHHYHHHASAFDDTLEEDERMVEELLLPPNSASSISPSPSFHTEMSASLPSPNPSSFTTADPFYLSQLQASQQAFCPNPAAAQGVFAQNGRITQGSQFALQTAF